MSYWNKSLTSSTNTLDNVSLSARGRTVKSTSDEFYEIEPAIVLDIILDIDHPYLRDKQSTLVPGQWPVDVNGKAPLKTDQDYTWIGRALIRLIQTNSNVEKEDLIWATPLESNISEYPVLNEIVGVVSYLGQYYYTRKINKFNTPNANADFNMELVYGGFTKFGSTNPAQGNRELLVKTSDPRVPYIGPQSKLNIYGGVGFIGALGRYFYYNPRIRSLKRREGDLVFESRFGQSIRFASYDDDRKNDCGHNSDFSGYTDYKGNGVKNPKFNLEAGGGNPMVLIRNRQRPISSTIVNEKNVGGYMLEDVNEDGTSIHLTSGVTLSLFNTTKWLKKKMWGNGSEEQPLFNGITNFKFPKLIGDQLVINSDRVTISAKKNELFQYSKKRMAFVTDDECTIDAQNQIIITTNNKTVLNSPAIYLGEYNQTNEPVLLGQTSVNWLFDLCNWLLAHTHWYNHKHPDAQGGTTGNANPTQTQTTVQAASLTVLRNNLNLLMSRRVFTVGGGLAPGANGGTIPSGEPAVTITTPAGSGVPGGWSGSNRKYSTTEKQKIQTQIEESKAIAMSVSSTSDKTKASVAAVKEDLASVQSSVRKYHNGVTVTALKTVQQQLKLANTNALLSKQYSDQVQTLTETAATTDNEAVRIEANIAAKDAADKSKHYANLAEENKKAANSAAAVAAKEVSNHEAAVAANNAAKNTKLHGGRQ